MTADAKATYRVAFVVSRPNKCPYRNSGAFACSFSRRKEWHVPVHRPHSRTVRRLSAGQGNRDGGAPRGSSPAGIRGAGSRLQRELASRERDGAAAHFHAVEAV